MPRVALVVPEDLEGQPRQDLPAAPDFRRCLRWLEAPRVHRGLAAQEGRDQALADQDLHRDLLHRGTPVGQGLLESLCLQVLFLAAPGRQEDLEGRKNHCQAQRLPVDLFRPSLPAGQALQQSYQTLHVGRWDLPRFLERSMM